MSDGPRPWAWVWPGYGALSQGRWGTGVAALLLWTGSLVILVTRFDRVVGFLGGPLDLQIAVATLLAILIGGWVWARREHSAETSSGEGEQWAVVQRAFRKNRLAVWGAIFLLVGYFIAIMAPLLAPYDPTAVGSQETQRLLAPSWEHLLGTDQLARDVLSRLLYGARVSLSIGFIAVGISVTIGTVLGAVSGYLGGRIDAAIMRFVDMVISFPRLILLITIIALFTPSIFLVVVVLGLTQWPQTTRIVRGEVLSLREREFIQAARALGYSGRRIVFRHLIPNTMAPVIVAATLGIGNTIVLEAGLSFLGLGIQPPTPSWGSMVSDGRDFLLDAWWISTFSGLAIVFIVLAFNVVGDGLRDALDPRLRS